MYRQMRLWGFVASLSCFDLGYHLMLMVVRCLFCMEFKFTGV